MAQHSKSNKSANQAHKIPEKIVLFLVIAIVLVAAYFYFTGTDPVKTIEKVSEITENVLPEKNQPITEKTPLLSLGTAPPAPNESQESATAETTGETKETGDLSRVTPKTGDFSLIVLDIGQGDSIFLRTPKGKNMLVDTGENVYWSQLSGYLDAFGVKKIDVLVGTHPHSDHIGSLENVIKNYQIGQLYMPKVSHTSKTYRDLLQTIADKKMKVKTLRGGKNQTIEIEEGITIEVLAPIGDTYEEINDYSAVLLIRYGDMSFLLTGDAEKTSEKEMIAKYAQKLKVDVLKVGHHGSDSSSKKDFLALVQPEYAIISVDNENSYKHPHDKVLERLNEIKTKTYRTDQSGCIAIISNGKKIEVKTQK